MHAVTQWLYALSMLMQVFKCVPQAIGLAERLPTLLDLNKFSLR